MRNINRIGTVENVPVLVRASLNVPVQNGVVVNAFRLRAALPTITYLRKKHARVVLIGHIGDKGTETLRPVYEALRKDISGLVFCPVSTGREALRAIEELSPGGVIMLENLRRNAGETKNDAAFAEELAALGQIFVQDSFDVCHRSHASVVGVPKLLPSFAGLTVMREVQELSRALHPGAPSLAIIGGAKFKTKEPVLKKLLKTYSAVFVGGALANDFLKAQGSQVGVSLVSEESGAVAALAAHKRILVPVDGIVAGPGVLRRDARTCLLEEIAEGEAIFDAGPKTTAALVRRINRAKVVLWNGPLGLYEHGYTDATQMLARAIAGSTARSIIGGGDTIAAIEDLGLSDQFSFISTGGGAMLDYLASGTLPGLAVLTKQSRLGFFGL